MADSVSFDDSIHPINIEDEMRQSYLDYAMSVIVGRALPDVRDGLKPVHRRVLFAMSELNNDWNKAYKKSARVVGDVIGKYHPHGDSAVYDTIVRMAQPFALRYPLIDGQGNFGSLDGDRAAAMRYTEIRMAKITQELLADLEKETVDYVPNYDGEELIPDVLPTKLPNLLVNGSSGIAVGMATNIAPHNLTEVIRACLRLIDEPESSIDDLMQDITGPDFPTGGIINGRAGIVQAYRTGRGRIYVRAKTHIEDHDKNNRQSIIVDEMPYQVNKAKMVERIAELVKDKKIEGISELRDESDKDGVRVVIELRRGEVAEVVLNNLFAQTQLQTVFGINMVALDRGQPRLFNLKQLLEAFLNHRREVVTRRTLFLLRKARERGHILEGQAVALSNIDPVIQLIKESSNPQEAKVKLLDATWDSSHVLSMLERVETESCRPEGLGAEFGLQDNGRYRLSPDQAQAILDLRLHRLTGLEHEKLLKEYTEILEKIAEYLAILSDTNVLMDVIRDELNKVLEGFGDDRRTEVISSQQDLTMADLITEEDRVVTLSHGGYAKSQPLTTYSAQRRGGKGKAATAVKDEDFVEHLLIANSHDTILCFSNTGKVYWLRVFDIPTASRTSRGRPMVNLLPLDEDERITSILPVHEYLEDHYVFMATAKGTVKKTSLVQFSRPRSVGLRAIELEEGDRLIGTAITSGTCSIMLVSSAGKVVVFKESDVRAMGRTARGVRGIKLAGEHQLISLIIPNDDGFILTASEQGFGKRTAITEFPIHSRGGQGVIGMQTSERNGNLVGAIQVFAGDQLMLISDQGTLVRTRSEEVSKLGRNTQGVRLINVKSGEKLVGLARVEDTDEESEENLIDTDDSVSIDNDTTE